MHSTPLRRPNIRNAIDALATTSIKFAIAAVVWSVAPAHVLAQPESPPSAVLTPGLSFSGSGFVTIAAGKVLRGTQHQDVNLGWDCPCYIADFAQAGIYESGGVSMRPDSKLGLQGRVATEDNRYALTGQIVARGATGSADLEWLYATVELDPRWTLQVGRKRLPLFAYSDVQDVGVAIPWIHLPGQLYGWEAVNYNGVNVQHRRELGPVLGTLNVFAGAESVRDSGIQRIYSGKDSRTDVKWSGIFGVELKLEHDGYEARYLYLQSGNRYRLVSDGETEFGDTTHQRIHGLSFGIDRNNWIGRAELQAIDRTEEYGRDFGELIAVGYRLGRWTPLVSWARYHQRLNDADATPESHWTRSFVLRYDIDPTSAIKLQYDIWRDGSGSGFESQHGNAHLIAIAYERVF